MALVTTGTGVPSKDLSKRVTAVMLRLGTNATAQKLGASRLVLSSIAAGLPVRRGSILLVAATLPALEEQLASQQRHELRAATADAVTMRQRLTAK